MGLDIYAGTLTRYYAHNWKTVVQQWAEENGYEFSLIDAQGEPVDDGEEVSPDEIQTVMENWRDRLLASMVQSDFPSYTPWREDNEKPYYTDKPDWDAFGAMLLVAACHIYGEAVPDTVEKDWDFDEDPLIERLSMDEENMWSLFCGTTLWLPLPDDFFMEGPLPTGDIATVGTVSGLRNELERLNEMAWQADEDTIIGWADTEGYPVDADGTDSSEHTRYDTQSLAKLAFSIFWRAVRFSEEEQVPILMDF